MMWGHRGYAFRGGWGHPGGLFMIWPMVFAAFLFFMLFKFVWPVLLIGLVVMLMRGAFSGGRRWHREGHRHGWHHRHGHRGHWGKGWGHEWGKDWGRHWERGWGWHDGDEKPKRKNDDHDYDEKPKRDGETWYV